MVEKASVELKDKAIKPKYIINRLGTFKQRWDYVIIVGALINCFAVPYKLAYNPAFLTSDMSVIANLIIDLFFVIDIIFNFRTTFLDEF